MTRDEVIVRVAAVIPAVLSDAGISVSDTAGNMKEPVDAALEAMGLDLSTLEVDDPVGFVALVKYHSLLAAEGRAADRFDVTVPSGSFRLAQVLATLQKMIERSEKEVSVLFGTFALRSQGARPFSLHFLTGGDLVAW